VAFAGRKHAGNYAEIIGLNQAAGLAAAKL
jgi:hypothetical protein